MEILQTIVRPIGVSLLIAIGVSVVGSFFSKRVVSQDDTLIVLFLTAIMILFVGYHSFLIWYHNRYVVYGLTVACAMFLLWIVQVTTFGFLSPESGPAGMAMLWPLFAGGGFGSLTFFVRMVVAVARGI